MDMNANNKLKRKKKTHGPGNPSKRHRDRLNAELDNLARLLPFPEEIVTKLDKISILRLTVSYLRAKSFFQVSNGRREKEETCEELVREVEGNGVFSQLSLEALDGFIAVVTQDGQLFYVSENVRDFLGYSQAAVIHQSMFKFLHIDDQDMVKTNLAWPKPTGKKIKVSADKEAETSEKDVKTGSEDNDSLNRSFTCRMKCTLNHGGGFYKLFKLSGRLREIHTRKRDSQIVEYGLFAICSPATSPHQSGSSVKREVALTAQKRLERANSDPLPNRRPGLSTMTGMMHPFPVNHNFTLPEGHTAVVSPLASPTTSTDSGHPSPDSSQGGKVLVTDGDIRSDMREASPSSSSNSQDTDGRRVSERFLSGAKNPFMHVQRVDHRRPANLFDSWRTDSARKRSQSLADASELFLGDRSDQRPLFFQSNLPPIPEVKAEDAKKQGECNFSCEVPTKRPLSSHDNRLDAAQGLVSLGNMATQFPGLYPFPPELVYPDVMFPRPDMLQDFQHLRTPFDIHNPCYLGADPYTALAMRRWLSSPDVFRSSLNPLLAAQAGLLTPAERLRLLQFPLGYHYPFPGPSPFDLGPAPGLSERNFPEYSIHGFYRNGLMPEVIRGSAPKEQGKRHSPSTEKQPNVRDGSSSPLKKRLNPEKVVTVKKETVDVDNCDERDSAKEESLAPERNISSCSGDEDYDEEEVKVDVVGGVKPTSVLRQTFAGIQEEFTSRLENLNTSFAQSLDHTIVGPKKD